VRLAGCRCRESSKPGPVAVGDEQHRKREFVNETSLVYAPMGAALSAIVGQSIASWTPISGEDAAISAIVSWIDSRCAAPRRLTGWDSPSSHFSAGFIHRKFDGLDRHDARKSQFHGPRVNSLGNSVPGSRPLGDPVDPFDDRLRGPHGIRSSSSTRPRSDASIGVAMATPHEIVSSPYALQS